MPYPEDNLHPHEELVLHLHPHWWYLAKSCAALVVAVIVGLLIIANNLWDPLKILGAILVLGSLVWFVERYIRWISTHFVLTSDRVIWRAGIIAKNGVEIPLESINAIHFSQRIFERILGLGDLQIDSASVLGVSEFEDIKHPDKVQNEIYLQMEANDQRRFNQPAPAAAAPSAPAPPPGPPAAAAPPPLAVHEQLEKLSELRDRGVITDEEFQAKKTELLGRM